MAIDRCDWHASLARCCAGDSNIGATKKPPLFGFLALCLRRRSAGPACPAPRCTTYARIVPTGQARQCLHGQSTLAPAPQARRLTGASRRSRFGVLALFQESRPSVAERALPHASGRFFAHRRKLLGGRTTVLLVRVAYRRHASACSSQRSAAPAFRPRPPTPLGLWPVSPAAGSA